MQYKFTKKTLFKTNLFNVFREVEQRLLLVAVRDCFFEFIILKFGIILKNGW